MKYAMKHLKAITTSQYFTEGQVYPILTREGENYIITDNDNKDHYITIEYAIDHFMEID